MMCLCGLVVRVPGYRSRGSGFDSFCYQIFWEVVALERGPLSLVSTIEELLGRNSSGSSLENRDYSHGDPLRWPEVDTNFMPGLRPRSLVLVSHVLPFLCIILHHITEDIFFMVASMSFSCLVLLVCAFITSEVTFCWNHPSPKNSSSVWWKLYTSILSRFQGSEQCLELLIRHFGPSIVNLRDRWGRTPLHVAAFHDSMDCMQVLLSSGASVEARDVTGKTPLLVAACGGQCSAIGECCPQFNCKK
jgi:hypothetical protein